MCTNYRWITNKYTGTRILLSCGKCKACLQDKANKRATRIKNEYSPEKVALFVTLTYDRFSCPYIKHEDVLNNLDPLPIYRDCSFRYNPKTHQLHRRFERNNVVSTLDGVLYDTRYNWLPYLKKSHGNKVGVCIFKDIQDFNKRLRQNLKRLYKYEKGYKVYNTFEYGEDTLRPHIHLLLFCPSEDVALFKSAIVESWPFAHRDRTRHKLEIARDAASYVASYVNSGSKLPSFLAVNFPPKHSFSQGLGVSRPCFQLDALLENVERQNMSYNLSTVKDGIPTIVNLPIPKYVINRYFPLFKGYSRLTVREVYDVLESVTSKRQVWQQLYKLDFHRISSVARASNYVQREQPVWWYDEDVYKIATMLHNAYTRYHMLTGKNEYDFAIDYQNTWSCYKNTIIKRFMLDDEPEQYRYDNRLSDRELVTPRRNLRDRELSDLYDKKCKTRFVNNSVESKDFYDV